MLCLWLNQISTGSKICKRVVKKKQKKKHELPNFSETLGFFDKVVLGVEEKFLVVITKEFNRTTE